MDGLDKCPGCGELKDYKHISWCRAPVQLTPAEDIDCSRCHHPVSWRSGVPEDVDDRICDECAWRELQKLRKLIPILRTLFNYETREDKFQEVRPQFFLLACLCKAVEELKAVIRDNDA